MESSHNKQVRSPNPKGALRQSLTKKRGGRSPAGNNTRRNVESGRAPRGYHFAPKTSPNREAKIASLLAAQNLVEMHKLEGARDAARELARDAVEDKEVVDHPEQGPSVDQTDLAPTAHRDVDYDVAPMRSWKYYTGSAPTWISRAWKWLSSWVPKGGPELRLRGLSYEQLVQLTLKPSCGKLSWWEWLRHRVPFYLFPRLCSKLATHWYCHERRQVPRVVDERSILAQSMALKQNPNDFIDVYEVVDYERGCRTVELVAPQLPGILAGIMVTHPDSEEASRAITTRATQYVTRFNFKAEVMNRVALSSAHMARCIRGSRWSGNEKPHVGAGRAFQPLAIALATCGLLVCPTPRREWFLKPLSNLVTRVSKHNISLGRIVVIAVSLPILVISLR